MTPTVIACNQRIPCARFDAGRLHVCLQGHTAKLFRAERRIAFSRGPRAARAALTRFRRLRDALCAVVLRELHIHTHTETHTQSHFETLMSDGDTAVRPDGPETRTLNSAFVLCAGW